MVRLDIFADPICPWCLIGKRLLEAALAEHPDHPFTIAWQPFQLNPEMPRAGMDRRTYLEAKFGGQTEAVRAYAEIDQRARAVGIELNLGAIARTPNTLDAQRLIHWAGIEHRQSMVVEALFQAYFIDGQDIGDPAVLTGIAASAGLDGALVARLLASDADLDGIRERDAHARARGVTGAPTFIVADTHVLVGAQPTALWLQVIAELVGAAPKAGLQ
ncbi:DsbA family oxidoreductase [Rhodovulum sulfidophilum]|uniref:DsbA family oxidoreductase n=1 Tax=Rhodovulum sulfidophilum TaxID=35806 RepID=UPI0019216055|nr:DsbA family oxidoreductase [Rhodovulum sulfidophilum]MBL3572572.1 DsbA family oxidoreductase [Rhodovulum sulfidophilum]MCE8431625.1 DsbA family oxidoreductase [Rhodovulum sulfidophilum]MCF4116649.1 DsbA family oxidoreductase [Rhodovulum sulfidophilum]